MALEAELENAMLDHEGKDGTEHAAFSEACQFDDELDLSTEVVLRGKGIEYGCCHYLFVHAKEGASSHCAAPFVF